MSSHREAPEISQDPVADSTDVYAFVSPDRPDTVTLIANYLPFQLANGGPNFYEFGDDVRYEINISHLGRAEADITYRFDFFTRVRNPNTFLYNTGPIDSINSTSWNRPQFYSVTRIQRGREQVLARGLPCPPVNVGVRSTPDYPALAAEAVHQVGPRRFFAGQRADPFHVDLGSIFDLGGLRPLNGAHLIPLATEEGVNALRASAVHSIALQVPISDLTRGGNAPKAPLQARSVIGVWTSAYRRKSRIFSPRQRKYVERGPWQQVSRLGNPLFNEVIVPMPRKDGWNSRPPKQDRLFENLVFRPELQGLLPVLYPGAFENLAAYRPRRADLHAILLTGIPNGVVNRFQNYTGPTPSDMLRLNIAIPPARNPNNLGVVAGDLAGFPNGRRIRDDVVSIELKAIAGLTIPLVDPDYEPDAAVEAVTDDSAKDLVPLLDQFPYLGTPGGGYQAVPGRTGAA